jgi:hypothetical protein
MKQKKNHFGIFQKSNFDEIFRFFRTLDSTESCFSLSAQTAKSVEPEISSVADFSFSPKFRFPWTTDTAMGKKRLK